MTNLNQVDLYGFASYNYSLHFQCRFHWLILIRLLLYAFRCKGMFDLGAPCNKIEIHAICKLLDTGDTETIEYLRVDSLSSFARCVWHIHRIAEADCDRYIRASIDVNWCYVDGSRQ